MEKQTSPEAYQYYLDQMDILSNQKYRIPYKDFVALVNKGDYRWKKDMTGATYKLGDLPDKKMKWGFLIPRGLMSKLPEPPKELIAQILKDAMAMKEADIKRRNNGRTDQTT